MEEAGRDITPKKHALTKEMEAKKWKKGESGNPAGRPEGSISLLTDIKKRLLQLAKEDPTEYQALIDYYWRDKKMRELLIKMIDGMPRQSTDVKIDTAFPVPSEFFEKYKINDPARNTENSSEGHPSL